MRDDEHGSRPAILKEKIDAAAAEFAVRVFAIVDATVGELLDLDPLELEPGKSFTRPRPAAAVPPTTMRSPTSPSILRTGSVTERHRQPLLDYLGEVKGECATRAEIRQQFGLGNSDVNNLLIALVSRGDIDYTELDERYYHLPTDGRDAEAATDGEDAGEDEEGDDDGEDEDDDDEDEGEGEDESEGAADEEGSGEDENAAPVHPEPEEESKAGPWWNTALQTSTQAVIGLLTNKGWLSVAEMQSALGWTRREVRYSLGPLLASKQLMARDRDERVKEYAVTP
jgi:hypothetical protein